MPACVRTCVPFDCERYTWLYSKEYVCRLWIVDTYVRTIGWFSYAKWNSLSYDEDERNNTVVSEKMRCVPFTLEITLSCHQRNYTRIHTYSRLRQPIDTETFPILLLLFSASVFVQFQFIHKLCDKARRQT